MANGVVRQSATLARLLAARMQTLRSPASRWPRRESESTEDGATLVEFAVSAAVLLSLVFGVIGLSTALYSYHFVSYAAHAGTRYAMVRGATCPGILQGCPPAGSPVDVQSYLRSLTFPGIISSRLTATTTFSTTGPACPDWGTPCDNPGNLVQVTVSYQFPLAIPFVPPNVWTMSSTSQMVISQ